MRSVCACRPSVDIQGNFFLLRFRKLYPVLRPARRRDWSDHNPFESHSLAQCKIERRSDFRSPEFGQSLSRR